MVTVSLIVSLNTPLMPKDYIPRPNAQFNIFQKNLVQHTVANAVAWNIPAGEVNALAAASATYGNLYKIISNKGDRTKSQVLEHNLFRKTYEADLRKFVNNFLRNNEALTAGELTNMSIPQRSKKRSSRSAITDSPVLIVESIPGAYLRFLCRRQNHEGRASIHPESDGVELRFSIGTEYLDYNHAQHILVRKHAHIRLPVKPEWRGKTLYAFARCVNLTDDSRSSPWCDVVMQGVY